jgi:hypothetical protein
MARVAAAPTYGGNGDLKSGRGQARGISCTVPRVDVHYLDAAIYYDLCAVARMAA